MYIRIASFLIVLVTLSFISLLLWNKYSPISISCSDQYNARKISCDPDAIRKALKDTKILEKPLVLLDPSATTVKKAGDVVYLPQFKKINPRKIQITFTNKKYRWYTGYDKKNTYLFSSQVVLQGQTVIIDIGLSENFITADSKVPGNKHFFYNSAFYTSLFKVSSEDFQNGASPIDYKTLANHIKIINKYVLFN